MKKRILQIIDTKFWAIDRLATAIVKHNPQFEWKQIYLHPRDLDANKIDMQPVIEAIEWCDAVDAQYWRVISLLLERVPALKNKPIVLTHHNEENLLSRDWKDIAIHIAKTKYSKVQLEKAGYKDVRYIPNSFNPEVFKWNPDWPPHEPAVGYVGRIVDWKGLKEIARACKELGVKLYAMGKGNDQGYYDSIPEADRDNIDWSFFEYPDDRIAEFYQNITCYVCNSSPHREVGPLPLIEAMASGVPVVSTPCGIARDIGVPRENMMIVPFGEYEVLRDSIKEILDSATTGNELRQVGWRTIKNFSDNVMARSYSEVFYNLLSGSLKPWVSVIIPATADRVEQVKEILKALEAQTYPNIEALVIWDGDTLEMGLQAQLPLRELNTGVSGYNLAQARNLGVTEACGEVIVLCDSRFAPTPTGIAEFVKKLDDYRPEDKVWLFGDKVVKGLSAGKKTFVENWSCINRQQLINAGMFNERVNLYGGMSQELRSRFMSQGFELVYLPQAQANEIMKSSSKGFERKQSMIKAKELLNKLNLDK